MFKRAVASVMAAVMLMVSSFTVYAGTGSGEYGPGMVQNNDVQQYESVLLHGYVFDVQGDEILGMSETTDTQGLDVIENGIYKYHGRDYLVEYGCILYDKWYDSGDGNAAYFSMFGSRSGSGYDFSEEYESLNSIEFTGEADGEAVWSKEFELYVDAYSFMNYVFNHYNMSDTDITARIYFTVSNKYKFDIMDTEETRKALRETKEAEAGLKAVTESLGLDGMNQEDKIKTIYDWICSHAEYDYSISLRKAYSGLLTGKVVCVGYAQMFYHMCRNAGIEAEIVCGVSSDENGQFNTDRNFHAWNRVKTGDTCKYYDVTFDDGSGSTENRYMYYGKELHEMERDHFMISVYR